MSPPLGAGKLRLQNEPGELERGMPLAIGTWWPGHKTASQGSDDDPGARLAQAIGSAQASIRVVSPASYKPEKAPGTWPYILSRGKGTTAGPVFTLNTHDFVSWIRVDDEVMRVTGSALDGGIVKLVVDRGYFGTHAAAHGEKARVMSPVYIGSTSASSGDVEYGGSPAIDNPNRALRYAMKVWRPEFIDFLAGSIKHVFGNGRPAPYLQGINAGFLDITSCIAYNQGDPYGSPVSIWDDPAGTVMQAAAQGRHQIEKVRGLRERFGGTSGYPALFWIANNVGANGRIDECHNNPVLRCGRQGRGRDGLAGAARCGVSDERGGKMKKIRKHGGAGPRPANRPGGQVGDLPHCTLDKIYIQEAGKPHAWTDFTPYYEKYDHAIWKSLGETAKKYGHNGGDYIELQQFVKAVREKRQTPIDVYDCRRAAAS